MELNVLCDKRPCCACLPKIYQDTFYLSEVGFGVLICSTLPAVSILFLFFALLQFLQFRCTPK